MPHTQKMLFTTLLFFSMIDTVWAADVHVDHGFLTAVYIVFFLLFFCLNSIALLSEVLFTTERFLFILVSSLLLSVMLVSVFIDRPIIQCVDAKPPTQEQSNTTEPIIPTPERSEDKQPVMHHI